MSVPLIWARVFGTTMLYALKERARKEMELFAI
jgi:hypothetical protein